MTIQASEAVRNAKLNVVESTIGPSAFLNIRTGPPPLNCAAANTGDSLAVLALPVDWMDAASGGVKAMAGVWQVLNATGTGTAGHFRIFANDATTCGIQGTVTLGGGGGDMIINVIDIEEGMAVTVVTFSLTEGNA